MIIHMTMMHKEDINVLVFKILYNILGKFREMETLRAQN